MKCVSRVKLGSVNWALDSIGKIEERGTQKNNKIQENKNRRKIKKTGIKNGRLE